MDHQDDGWQWENTGGGVMRWTLGGFVIGGPAGEDPVEGRPCYVSHFANGHENAVEFPNPEGARRAVTLLMVESDADELWGGSLTEWIAANEEDPDCADAAMQMLGGNEDPIYFGGGAAPLTSVRRSRVEV